MNNSGNPLYNFPRGQNATSAIDSANRASSSPSTSSQQPSSSPANRSLQSLSHNQPNSMSLPFPHSSQSSGNPLSSLSSLTSLSNYSSLISNSNQHNQHLHLPRPSSRDFIPGSSANQSSVSSSTSHKNNYHYNTGSHSNNPSYANQTHHLLQQFPSSNMDGSNSIDTSSSSSNYLANSSSSAAAPALSSLATLTSSSSSSSALHQTQSNMSNQNSNDILFTDNFSPHLSQATSRATPDAYDTLIHTLAPNSQTADLSNNPPNPHLTATTNNTGLSNRLNFNNSNNNSTSNNSSNENNSSNHHSSSSRHQVSNFNMNYSNSNPNHSSPIQHPHQIHTSSSSPTALGVYLKNESGGDLYKRKSPTEVLTSPTVASISSNANIHSGLSGAHENVNDIHSEHIYGPGSRINNNNYAPGKKRRKDGYPDSSILGSSASHHEFNQFNPNMANHSIGNSMYGMKENIMGTQSVDMLSRSNSVASSADVYSSFDTNQHMHPGQVNNEHDESLSSVKSKPRKKSGQRPMTWTREEEDKLRNLVKAGTKWPLITREFPNRSAGAIKKHFYADMKHTVWREEEDNALQLVFKEDESNKWKRIGEKLGRPPKACEKRMNELLNMKPGEYISPEQSRREYEEQEAKERAAAAAAAGGTTSTSSSLLSGNLKGKLEDQSSLTQPEYSSSLMNSRQNLINNQSSSSSQLSTMITQQQNPSSSSSMSDLTIVSGSSDMPYHLQSSMTSMSSLNNTFNNMGNMNSGVNNMSNMAASRSGSNANSSMNSRSS